MKSQEGYLTKQSGKWLGHYSRWILDHKTGQKKRRQRAFVIGPVSEFTKTKAKNALRERMVKDLGITVDSKATVAWFIEHRWKPMREGTWRDGTRITNNDLLRIINERFGTTALEDVDGVHMQAWLNTLAKERSGSAVRHIRIFLKSIFTEATEQDYVRKNPARSLKVPRLRAVQKPYLSLEQVKALLKAATFYPRDRALLRLILVTALRPSEIFALRWRCLDFKEGTLTISETVYRGELRPYTKTTEEGDIQRLLVPKQALDALAEWHTKSKHTADDDFIFPSPGGGYWWKENYQRRVLPTIVALANQEKAGIRQLNFQILRRTVATHAQDLGSPKDIATIMRHKKVETAQAHYIQAIDESVKQTGEKLAAKMLRKG